MDLLIDTHILLWYLLDSTRLTEKARDYLQDPANNILVSTASIWEASIKAGIGKLRIPAPLAQGVRETGFSFMPISPEDAWEAGQLPLLHKDPFDRMLIAQARLREIPVFTDDSAFSRYEVPVLLP